MGLYLNGCRETAARRTMTVHNKIITDAADGRRGKRIVTALTIGGVARPADTNAALSAEWLEGQGRVIVRP